jgi:hypothetical protein
MDDADEGHGERPIRIGEASWVPERSAIAAQSGPETSDP